MVPTVATTRAGAAPAAASRLDRVRELVAAHAAVFANGDRAQALTPEPRDAHRLLDRRMGFDRRVEPEPVLARYPAAVRREPGRPLPGGEYRAQGRARRSVLDDPREALRKPEHLPQPVEDAGLELGAGGRRLPEHAVHAESGGQHLREHRGRTRVCGKVRVERRVLPVRDPGEQIALEVGEYPLERLARFRWGGGKPPLDLARFDAGPHRPRFDRLQVVGHPVHEAVRVAPVLRNVHRLYPRSNSAAGARASRVSTAPAGVASPRTTAATCSVIGMSIPHRSARASSSGAAVRPLDHPAHPRPRIIGRVPRREGEPEAPVAGTDRRCR